jgi:hypothetical protein
MSAVKAIIKALVDTGIGEVDAATMFAEAVAEIARKQASRHVTKPRDERPTYVYVIGRPQGPVKVGISHHPGGRLSTLRTASSFPIDLLFAKQAASRGDAEMHERIFHKVFAASRAHGEWFNMESAKAIDEIEKSFGLEEFFDELERSGACQ